jgi:hypothetical protein
MMGITVCSCVPCGYMYIPSTHPSHLGRGVTCPWHKSAHVRRQREGHHIARVPHKRGALLTSLNIPQCAANKICLFNYLKSVLGIKYSFHYSLQLLFINSLQQ